MASSLDLRFDVLSNMAGGCYVRLTFTNKGRFAISSGKWKIYFSIIRAMSHDANPFASNLKKMTVAHIDGYLHKLTPTKAFPNLLPGRDVQVDLYAKGAIVAKTDVMPNWYVTARGLEPRIIESTKGESLKFVGSFDSASKWKRSPQDMYNPYTPEKRFKINNIADLKRPGNLIIPTPLVLKYLSASQTVDLNSGKWNIVAQRGLDREARYLAEKLKMKFIKTKTPPRKFIELKIGTVDIKHKNSDNDEAYSMEVDPEKEVIKIVGKTPKGVFWGVQTLLSIVNNGKVPWVTVKDAPRYEYRGLSIDVARNFLPKKEVMKIIDGMAMFKMNKLHLHLTDDEGWRLEIPGLPELTKVASQRCHDLQEAHCLAPQLGSGPFNNTSGSGHYTVKDYQEILKHAKARHIQIIPEFDLPGHSHAAIKAMEARYKRHRDMDQIEDGLQFYLNDLKDESIYQSGQFFFNNSVNPCIETSYQFVDKLVHEVKALHKGIQPLKAIHLGGDEVPLGAWSLSPACQELSEKIKSDYPDWKAFFIQRIARIVGKYGVHLALWEDGLMDHSHTPVMRSKLGGDEVYGYAWGNTMNLGYRLANDGYKVIMTQASYLYFDHPHEPDPEERGIYWATRYTDTRKAFGFMPEHLYDSIEKDGDGRPIADYCSEVGGCVPPQKLDNIVGLAGAIWSETIRTPAQFQSMIFPRLLAVAERSWHQDAWENSRNKLNRNRMKEASWTKFANTLGYKELARLDKLGIAYHIPVPGARMINGVLVTNVAFPGLTVECSIDGGRSWFDPNKATVVSGKLLLRARSADGKRTSRTARTTLSRNYFQKTLHNNYRP
ncbi:beta-hexosaminidase-like isoform X2 [Oculina patagonica]